MVGLQSLNYEQRLTRLDAQTSEKERYARHDIHI